MSPSSSARQSFAAQWQQRKQHYLAQGFHPSEAGHYAWRDFGVVGPGAAEPEPEPSKQTKPETPGQAATWEKVKNRYLQAGLCHKCAAQAAWGHQIGFTHSHAPCGKCRPLVGQLPYDAAGDWRAVQPARLGHRSKTVDGDSTGTTKPPGIPSTPHP